MGCAVFLDRLNHLAETNQPSMVLDEAGVLAVNDRDEFMSRHAEVKIGEYTIPLIGIPEDATKDECDLCHKKFYIGDLHLAGGYFYCEPCFKAFNPLLKRAKISPA